MGLYITKLIYQDIENIERDRLKETKDSVAAEEIKRNTELLKQLTENVQKTVDIVEQRQKEETDLNEYEQKVQKYEDTIQKLVEMVVHMDNKTKNNEARLNELEKAASDKRVNEIAEHMGDNREAGKILTRSLLNVYRKDEDVSGTSSKAKGKFYHVVKQVIKQNEEKSVIPGFVDSMHQDDFLNNRETISLLLNMKVQSSVIKKWKSLVAASKSPKE